MQLVDSHCHIDWLPKAHDEPIEKLMQAATEAGVSHFLCVAITLEDFDHMCQTVVPYDNVHISVGLHPNELVAEEPTVAELVALSKTPKVVAIGETGLDYYRTEENTDWQQQRFRAHIQAARQVNLPIIVHSRQARDDTISIMREEKADEIRGVMHCFTEDWAMAQRALDLGFYISFSGIVSFKNAKELHEVARKIPLDRMLIETDCPYLAPMPFRGKPNQPAYVRYVADAIAELRGISVEEVAEKTTANFFELFKGAAV